MLVEPLLSEAWTLRHNITVTVALDIVLGRHLDATLVTADVSLANAPGLDVTVLIP